MTSSKAALLAEAESLLKKTTFTKEDSSKVENLLQLSDRLTDRTALRHAVLHARDVELGRAVPREPSSEDVEFRRFLVGDQRAQSTLTSAGGFLVPAAFFDRFLTILKQYDGIFEASTLLETSTGSAVNLPIVDDVGTSAQIVAENVTSNSGDVTFAALQFPACPTWRSDLVTASVELLADSAFPIEDLLARAFAVRFARGVGASFMSTLLGAAALGKTAASPTAITGDELLDLWDAVDPAFAANGSWLMQRSTLGYIYRLKGASSGDYLFAANTDSNGRPTLFGRPVYLSPGAGPMTTTGKSVLFGDLSQFIRRQVRNSFEVKSYPERNCELGLGTFQGFLRVDGGLAQSGANVPIKYLQQA